MRAFLVACVAAIAIGTIGYFAVDSFQEASGSAYTTDGARIDASWSWRTSSGATKTCEPRSVWQWFFVDFGSPAGESGLCSISQ